MDIMDIHREEPHHKCTTCGKSFKGKRNLTQHQKTHTGERPYDCSVCGKSYSHSSHLADHMRTHSEETPYLCTTCGKSFKVKRYLTQHQKTHSEETPHQCPICGKGLKWKHGLKDHMLTHTEEAVQKGSSCGKVFKSSAAAHQNAKHVKMHQSQPKSVPDVRSCSENTTQETLSSSTINGTDNGSVLESLSAWEEANQLQLHSSKEPIVIHIKTEED